MLTLSLVNRCHSCDPYRIALFLSEESRGTLRSIGWSHGAEPSHTQEFTLSVFTYRYIKKLPRLRYAFFPLKRHGRCQVTVSLNDSDGQIISDRFRLRFGPMLIGVFFNTMLYGVSISDSTLVA